VSLDPARVVRALALDVQPLGAGAWRVSGGSEPHVVRGSRCTCADALYRRSVCKHVLAIHLHRLDGRVRDALREAVG
jgi:hypothetical protein